ncbi:hypothetical protein H0H87_003863 [Tephrocybe sp. NHM501043]|nr:hypothetical protein H0H87_003863 [Tephrocybe sp. NHM501043]
MASRRLAISSLLCNDDQVPDPVILAPHLRHPSQSSSSSFPHHAPSPSTTPTFQSPSQMPQLHRPSSSRHRLSSPSSSYPIPSPASGPPHQFPSPTMPSKLPSFGLEALVQAATEERRRLSGSSPAEPEIQRCPSPPVEQRHIHPLHHQPPTFRQHKPPEEHVRSPTQHHSPILSPVQMRSPSQPILSPVQLIRSPVYSPITQHHPQSRHRPQDRHRDDPQVRLSAPEDLQYRSPQSAYFSPPMQPRHQMVLDHRAQQQHELERQRLHHEQLLLQEQHHLQQQQKYARERQAPYSERQILPPPPPHTTRGPSMPLHVEPSSHHHPQPLPRPSLMTQPHPTGRKSDPGQHHQLLHPDPVPPPLSAPSFSQAMPTGETALHLNKKRRYSDSPAQVMPIDEKDRIHPEREKAAVGDLGYGRAEPAAHPWPRQPGSGYSHGRKHLALVELMTPNHEAQRSQSAISGVSIDTSRREGLPEVSSSEDSARERASCEVGPHPRGSREESLHAGIVREGHRPSGIHDGALHEGDPREGGSRDKSGSVIHHRRRSPPGSQSGRAIAAKKTEEVEQSLPDLLARAPEPTRLPNKERKSPLPEKDDEGTSLGPKVTPPEGVMGSAEKESRPVLSNKEAKTTIYEEKETRKRPPSRASIDCTPVVEPAPPKKQRTTHLPAASVPKAAEEDAHEWFLEHFDDYNVPVQSQPPRPPTPPPATVPSVHRSKTRTPTPTSMPDAADELEQELEELLADPPISKIEPDADMDVDLVVTELVAETLDADDAKTEDVGMEVDVEDELLSLLDDQPSTRRPPAKSATPGPSNAKLTLPTAATGARHISPPVIPVISVPSPATLLSPAARPSSTRPTSERGSMPPPALVTPGRVKDKEEKSMERSVSATTAPATKKKDALSKSGAKSKATAAVSAGTTTTKSRAKPGPKPKPKPSDASPLTGVKSRAATGPKKPAASRSRSTSVMPSGSAGPEGSEAKAEKQEEEEESEREEDKLYCVCKTTYDEDRFMIACDR